MSTNAPPVSMLDTQYVAQRPISGFFARACREILADRAPLPSMPDVALRIRAAMSKPDYDVRTIARLINADPGTCAYLMRVANSPLYGGAVQIKDLENAIVRLGLSATRNLVTSYALKAMFRTKSRILGRLMQQTWARSAKLAAVASVIATHSGAGDPDRAMLAGLMQDIGMLPLLLSLESNPRLVDDASLIESSAEAVAGKVGVMLLQKWNFDEDIVEVARSRKDWYRDPQPDMQLADLVLVARLHTSIGDEAIQELPPIGDLPAFRKLPLDKKDPEASLGFLREAESEIQEVMLLLGVGSR